MTDEGLSEEQLSIFDLLKKNNLTKLTKLTKANRERLTLASKLRLNELRGLVEPLDK